METTYEKQDLKTWALEDRPREKWHRLGRNNISDVELLAILLGSGSREDTAIGLAQKLLKSVEHDLHQLANLNHLQLMAFKGVGEVKALIISAAFELGRRREFADHKQLKVISSSGDAYRKMRMQFNGLQHEEFWILFVNRRLAVLSIEPFSRGGINGTVLDTRMILRRGLELQATGFIIAHNHPSGNLLPSDADILLTRKVFEAGYLMDIHLQDHLIITEWGYYSFRDDGDLAAMEKEKAEEKKNEKEALRKAQNRSELETQILAVLSATR